MLHKPDAGFYDTLGQAYTKLDLADRNVLGKALDGKKVVVEILPVRVLPYEYDYLYEEVLNLLTSGEMTTDAVSGVFKQTVQLYLSRQVVEERADVVEESVIDISHEEEVINYSSSYYEEDAKLGNRFRQKLYLNAREASWLNKFWNPDNEFLSIEGCAVAVIRLFLVCVKAVDKVYKLKSESIEAAVENAITKMAGGVKEDLERDIYLTIFNMAENAVREKYNVRIKALEGFPYEAGRRIFNKAFGKIVDETIEAKYASIIAMDKQTEIQINGMNPARWKPYFEEIKEAAPEQWLSQIEELALLNSKNPDVEDIFHAASKLFAPYDKLESIRFYMKYIYADLQSVSIDKKPLPKTIQKNLFSTSDQLLTFEAIANNLILTRDLSIALAEVPYIYTKKRRKIDLDDKAIAEAEARHLATVNTVNSILQDDEEVLINLLPQVVEIPVFSIPLNETQQELLKLFEENSLSLSDDTVRQYAKQKGTLKDHLINSINECCYDTLDDALIESSGDNYEIYENYYHKIINP